MCFHFQKSNFPFQRLAYCWWTGAIFGGWPLNKHICWFINLLTSTDLTAWCEMQVKIYLKIISEVNSECPGFGNADLKAIRRIINGMKQTEKPRDELGSVRPWPLVGVCDFKLNLLKIDIVPKHRVWQRNCYLESSGLEIGKPKQ